MFADPDDKVSSTFIETAVRAIDTGVDLVAFGFEENILESEGGGGIVSFQFEKRFELMTYDSILTILFPSIFAVLKNSFENWMAGKSLDVRRGAQIWKYIFRKSIIDKYYLRFPPHIIAGEDTMFLSSYILHCKSFLNISDVLYSYYIRPQGLYMSNLNAVNPHKTLQTKIDLLEERMRICGFYKMLTKSSTDEGRSLYAGSAILSCFQLAWL